MARVYGENLLGFTGGFWGKGLNYWIFNILKNSFNRNKDSKDNSTTLCL